jgi:hypothetical protein
LKYTTLGISPSLSIFSTFPHRPKPPAKPTRRGRPIHLMIPSGRRSCWGT